MQETATISLNRLKELEGYEKAVKSEEFTIVKRVNSYYQNEYVTCFSNIHRDELISELLQNNENLAKQAQSLSDRVSRYALEITSLKFKIKWERMGLFEKIFGKKQLSCES